MKPDEHTPCIACPIQVRDLYAIGRRVLHMASVTLRDDGRAEYDELAEALDRLRPFVEGHHANQVHAFSEELADARDPKLPEAT